MYRLLADGHSNGAGPCARLWSAGHGATWRADAKYAEQHHRLFLAAILNNG